MSKGLLGPLILIPSSTNNMTGTAVLTSAVMDLRTTRGASLQAVFTGTAAGAFVIQGSLNYSVDPGGNVSNAGTWNTLPTNTLPTANNLAAPAGSSGSSLADIPLTGIPWIRVIYTNASGTGTLVVYGHAKGE